MVIGAINGQIVLKLLFFFIVIYNYINYTLIVIKPVRQLGKNGNKDN